MFAIWRSATMRALKSAAARIPQRLPRTLSSRSRSDERTQDRLLLVLRLDARKLGNSLRVYLFA